MWISRIALANWRAYERVEFDIPRPKSAKTNVVIIGAENEVGKTSLLEAVTLCLFGEQGLDKLGRGMGKNDTPLLYGDFLRGAFYKHADLSSPKSSASITFEMEDGGNISVERVWYFGANREFRGDDVFVRKDGADIEIPALAEDRKSVLAGHIAEHFLPPSLSPFFLFDAARVQQMARSDEKEQVRIGIEGILGIPTVRRLIKDLHDYASLRRKEGMAGRATTSKMSALQENISKAEADSKQLADEVRDLDKRLAHANEEERGFVQRFGEMGGENAAGLSDLRKESARLQQVKKDLFDELAESLVGDFAMSLTGRSILTKTALRLRAEASRMEWERDKKKGTENYAKFVGNLERLNALSLPLGADILSALRDNLKTAWDGVWHPMPKECAEEILNSGFSEDERTDAVGRLEVLANFGVAGVKTLREEIVQNEKKLDAVEKKIEEARGYHTEGIQQLREQMMNKRNEILALEKKKGDCERLKGGVENDLARMRQEMGREINQRKDSDPLLHCAGKAETATVMLEGIIQESYSHHVADISREMTSAFRAMAHKGDIISKIQIENDCEIKVLTRDGGNLREWVQSHGESEIFSLALIAAIARVSENQFPFIIDTPLANLDRHHQHQFLRYFSSDMDNQVILLSTDAEIREEHMDLIQRRVARTFLIEQEKQGGVMRNVVRPGLYFGGKKID